MQRVSSSEYFPNTVGNYWKYKLIDSIANTSSFVYVNIAGERLLPSGQNAKVWTYSYPDHRDTNYVYQENDTVRVLNQDLSIINTYIVPLQLNAKWNTTPDYLYDSVQVIENRVYTLNAQNFENSFLLLEQGFLPNDYRSRAEWFCPNIGIITKNERGLFTISIQYTNRYWELVEYLLK